MPTLELPALYADTVVSIVAVTRPLLVNRDPGPDETGVLLESAVALEIIDPGTDGIDRVETRVWLDGVLAFDGSSAPELQPGFDGPPHGWSPLRPLLNERCSSLYDTDAVPSTDR